MDSVTQLMIRACKSHNPYRRLHSVHRRFYLSTGTPTDVVLAQKLAAICDACLDIRVTDLVNDYHPENLWRVGAAPGQDHFTVSVLILISHIRYAHAKYFSGLRKAAVFRRRSAVLELEDEQA